MLRVCRLVYRKNSLVASDFVYLLSFSALAYPCRKSFRRPPRVYMARIAHLRERSIDKDSQKLWF